ncbi:DUF1217 domain-containing protein [Lentilitoribacter sp. EG35]|uniref:DUF1217 domain-containing protein n=1 Tax=Lentilitoribacter sp. EG35 TaxID=3234192 RepID=UPI0034607A49
MTTLTDYRLITRDMSASLKRVSEEPVVSRETKYYLENISKVDTIEDFLADDRLFSYAMKAHGLEEMTYAKGLIRKVLEGGTEDEDALANKFTDPRYKAFAEAFDFKTHEGNATIFTKAQQGTVDKYLQQTLEENAGNDNQGVRLALYFERKLPEILEDSSSDRSIAFSLLGDNALGEVIRTALSIPPESAAANIDRQADAILDKLDFDELKTPEGLTKFLEDFTALWEVNNSYGDPSSAALLGQSAGFGISSDLMLSINNLKLGGR